MVSALQPQVGPAADAGEARAGAAPGPLGNNADFAPVPFDIHAVLPPPGTVKAFYLRSLGRQLLKAQGIERRMRWCGSRIRKNREGVSVFARPDRAYGRISGVCVCAQSICCPVCAPRIAAFRAEEVGQAFQRAMDAGWEARLETFTKPHELDARPNALLLEFRNFSDLWRRYGKGWSADKRERSAEGHQLGREINWGLNGWHYHHHRLRFDRPGAFDPVVAEAQWLAVLEGAGLRTEGTERYAYDCSTVGTEAGARYVSKLSTSVEAQARAVGSELASSATKGRNINTLLADFARGDDAAGDVWVNGVSCVTATKISSVRWSRGLRYKLGMDVERSDEQISEEEVLPSDVFLGGLNASQWRGILKWKCELALLCAANRGRDAVNEFLAGLELGQLDDEPAAAVFVPLNAETAYRPMLPNVMKEMLSREGEQVQLEGIL